MNALPDETSTYEIRTKADLDREYRNGNWDQRLQKCTQKRVDEDYEYAADSMWYRRQILKEHYEGDTLVAFTIDYILHNGNTIRIVKMLLINGIRHIVP